MTNKINEAELLTDQENMGLGVEEDDITPQHSGNMAFTKAMTDVMPDKEVSQEEKDKNPFQYKYEIIIKRVPKKLSKVAGFKKGIKGRIIEVLDAKTVLVDFWNTSPSRFPIRTLYLELSRTREQVELESGAAIIEEVVKVIEDDLGVTTHPRPSVQPIKFDTGKPRMDLIRPEFTLSIGQALGYGADKYSEELGEIPNYLKGEGFHYSKIISSLERHLAEFKMGVDIDDESNLHHLALASANLMFLLTYELTDKGIDDRVVLGTKKRKAIEKPEKAVKNSK